MRKVLKTALIFQLLILALIAQALADVLLPNAAYQTRRFSRRAIDSASTNSRSVENDREIAALAASDQSDASISDVVERNLKVKSSREGGAKTGDVSFESESTAEVKSTKLLPALSNNHATISAEHKSSEKLALNRVESQSEEAGKSNERKAAVELLKNAAKGDVTSVEEKKEESDGVSTEPRNLSGKDENNNEEKDEFRTTRAPSTFSQAETTLQKSLAVSDAPKHIDNGLDEMELKNVGLENRAAKDETPATTEKTLKDLEEEALKLTTHAADATPTKFEHTEREIGNKSETVKENNVFMGRSMDVGAQSSQNILEEYFRGKWLKQEAYNNKTTTEEQQAETIDKQMPAATIKLQAENPANVAGEVASDFGATKIKSAVGNYGKIQEEKATVVAEHQQSGKQEETQSTSVEVEANETAAIEKPKQPQELAAANTGSQAQATEELNTNLQAQAEPKVVSQAQAVVTPASTTQTQEAARLKPNSKHNNSLAEKRAKFIIENATNMNLPDGSVAWSLASMRMVPKEMNNTNDEDKLDMRWQMNEIVTTERAVNISSYSEKNLLDWTKVMGMRGELEQALGAMEKNHLTEGIANENAMKYEKTHLPQEKLSEPKEGITQNRAGLDDSEPKTQLTTGGSVMLKQSEQTTTTAHIINEIDTMPFTTKTTFISESPLSDAKSDMRADFIDTAITAGVVSTPTTFSSPTSTALPAYSTASVAAQAPAFSTEIFIQQNERTGAAAQQLSTTQESKVQSQPSDDFNFIVTSTTPLALLEVTVGVTTTMSTANKANVLTTTTTTTPTIQKALPVEHSTSTTTTPPTATPSDAEATKRWHNETTSEAKAQFDEVTTTTEAPTLFLSSDGSAIGSSAKVAVTSKSNYSDIVHNGTHEQQLKGEPQTVVETKTETVEQNTLLTVSELQASKAHASLSADERKLLKVNASASENGQTVEDIGAATTIQNESANVATETTTASTHIATTAFSFINTPTTTLLSTTDLVDRNVSVNKTSEVQTITAKEIKLPPTTTEVSQTDNELELEVRTNESITGAVEGPTEATVGPTDLETATSVLNNDTGSSAHKVLDVVTVTDNDEPKTTEKNVVSINELLIPVNTTITLTSTSTVPITSTTTTLPPTQQTAAEPVLYTSTTPKNDESANVQKTPLLMNTTTTEQSSGSVDGNSATTSTTSTPVDFLPNHAADTESSSETNVIDQLDKQTTVEISETHESRASGSTNINALPDTTTKKGAGIKETTAGDVLEVKNESAQPGIQDGVTAAIATTEATTSTITTSTSTTMANVPLSAGKTPATEITKVNNTTSSATTTTEPPLINLLDDSTTTSTTPTAIPTQESSTNTPNNGMNPEEVYTLFSTTESTSANTYTTVEATSPSSSTSITTAVTPQVPKKTSTTDDTTTSTDTSLASSTTTTPLPPTYIPTVASTIATLTTTMLPPPLPTLHASIAGGGGSAGTPTHLPDMINAGIRPNTHDSNETDVNVIIAITVSVIGVVALILLVAFLYLMRKRQKQMSYGSRCRPVSLDAYSLDNVSVLGSVRRKGALRASKRSYGNIAFDDPSLRHNTLNASELAKFVERRSSIFEEFRDVPQIIARADEIPPGCEDKNRYANVIPLPETRVVLQQLGDDDKTEYINANYVRGPKDAPNYYIATQAPLETTVTDFWRMIWEQHSRVIIQATDLYENGIEKCAEYLPPSVTLDNHTTYGDFQITLKHREVKDKYAISTLMLKNIAENMSRELTHYWYKWPETGVPHEEAPIIAMLLEARSSLKGYVNETRDKSSNVTLKSDTNGEVTTNANGVTIIAVEDVSGNCVTNENGGNAAINGNIAAADKVKGTTLRNQGPLTIHCSPGTGRTGTIIASDMAIRSLETSKRSVDIPQIVYYVRRGRASAVQTKEQYEFIYKVAHMYATKITNLSNDN